MIYSIDVTIKVPVQPTEVTDRVVAVVTNLFPDATMEERPTPADTADGQPAGEIVATTHSLEHLSELFHEQTILDTARAAMLDGLEPETNTFEFRLKKQAAFEGVVNFAVGNPDELGDVRVTVAVEEPDPETYIRYLAPPTEDGVPVDDDQ
ncbi:RNA-binding domain-containing protein [Halocatena pleomorpha]|uniref:UPF0201 protein EIK79_01440 n=1 Tax=Halocatena pleomorpha TaxID=1785090 RepID=A0A3P3RJ12_9EURY|nr:RNA-binding domain-containing protein [Halocatena pleomorpha]RRJ33491.1 coaE operon protein [Halocatena pleomorpha]